MISVPGMSFTGGTATTRFGGGLSVPFGHLEFDEKEILIWGGSDVARATRPNIGVVRLSTGFLSVRVAIVRRDGTVVYPCFVTLSRDAVRTALLAWGWPVEETRWGRRQTSGCKEDTSST